MSDPQPRSVSIPTQPEALTPVAGGATPGGSDATVAQRRWGRPVLVIMFLVALLAAGGVTAFHVIDKRAADAVLASQRADIAAARAAVAAKEAELAAAQATAAKARADADAATRRANANEACVKAGQQLVAAGNRADEPGTTAAVDAIFKACR